MYKKTIVVTATALIGIGIWATLPRISNPSPDTQTELARMDFDGAEIRQAWPAPASDARIRARIVLRGEEIIFEDGPTDMIMNTHSMRKSFLGLLYGIAVDKGMIDLNETLAELNIDETTPLSDQEKAATIRDLLMFRSGIYLPAEGEHDSQITERPERNSHKPGEVFFSNNFDANALGTIFMQETGYEIGAFMEEFLARPLGMQDFTAKNVIMGDPWFWPNKNSFHQMYYMHLSARDTARIGAMVAQNGRWGGAQVVPEEWINTSISPLSDLTTGPVEYRLFDASGYMWWLYNGGEIVRTDGYGGHLMLIDPERDLVVVERNFSGNSYLSIMRWMMRSNKQSQSFDGAHKALAHLVGWVDES